MELIFGIIDLKNRIPQQEVDAALISLSLDAKRTLISKNIPNGILALANTQESSIGEEIVTGLKDDRYNYTSASFIDGVLKLENDPLGLRPILYYQQDHLFVFSSEIEPLLELKSLSLQVSNQGIQQYLTYGITLGESTFIKNLYNLSPNSCLTFDSINGLAINKKNSHFKEQIKNPTSKNINDILTRSTQAWIEKYNIEAANLSGGADTRILLACLDQKQRDSFTFFTDASPFLDRESDKDVIIAKQVADRYHLKHVIRDHVPTQLTDSNLYKRSEPPEILKLSGNHGGEVLGGDVFTALDWIYRHHIEELPNDLLTGEAQHTDEIVVPQDHPDKFLWSLQTLFRSFYSDIYDGGIFNHWTMPQRFTFRKCAPFWTCELILSIASLKEKEFSNYSLYAQLYREHHCDFADLPFHSPITSHHEDFPTLRSGSNQKESFPRPSLDELYEDLREGIRNNPIFNFEAIQKLKEQEGKEKLLKRIIKCHLWTQQIIATT